MSLLDFTTKPLVRDRTVIDGIVTPGIIHNEEWWNNEMFAWILKLTQHPEYLDITPADLIKLYMEHLNVVPEEETQPVFNLGYVYSASRHDNTLTDNTTVYLHSSDEYFTIGSKLYTIPSATFSLSTYTSTITFSSHNYYKKIAIGFSIVSNLLMTQLIQSPYDYETFDLAKNDTYSFPELYPIAYVIVQHDSLISTTLNASAIRVVSQDAILNLPRSLVVMHNDYKPIISYAMSLLSSDKTTVLNFETLQNHLQNNGIHGDSQIVLDHIADETLHGGGGGNANIDDSSFASNVTWSADKISTEFAQITSDVSIQNEDKTIYVPQITEITCANGIYIEDRGNSEVRLSVESSVSWEAISIRSNTQVGVKKIFGRKGRLVRANLFLENEGSGVQQITFDILKNGVSILSEYIVCTSNLSTIIKNLLLENVNETDYFEFKCINDGGFPSSNVSCQLVII